MAADQGKGGAASRYLCPFPSCNRSFRDFWRLKVHYRAAPDARGSGIERGHGEELPFCPLCNADLKKVRYHKCSALPTPVTARARTTSQAGQAQQQPRSAALTRRQSVGIGPPNGARGPAAGHRESPRGPGGPWGVDQVHAGFAPAAPVGPAAAAVKRALPLQLQQQLVPSVVPTNPAKHIVHQFRQQLANLRTGAAGSQQQQQVAMKPSLSGDASPALHQPLPAPNRSVPEQQQAQGPQVLPQKRPLADSGALPAAGSPQQYQHPPPSQHQTASDEDQGLLPYPLQQLADAGPAAKRRRSSATGNHPSQQQQQEPVSADGLVYVPSSLAHQLSGDGATLQQVAQQQQAVALLPMASEPAPSAAAAAGAVVAAGTASPPGSSGSSSRRGGPLSSGTPPPTDVLEGLLDLGADAAAAAAAQQERSFRDCTFRGQPATAAAGGGGGGGTGAFLASAPAADAAGAAALAGAGTRGGASPTQKVTLGDDLQQLLEGGPLITAVVPAAPSSAASVVIQYTEPHLVSPFATVAAAMDHEGDGLMMLPGNSSSGFHCGPVGVASHRLCQPMSIDASAATAVAVGAGSATPPLPAAATAAAAAADATSEASTGQFSSSSRDAGMVVAAATAAAATAAGAGTGTLTPLQGSSAALYEQSQQQHQQQMHGMAPAPAAEPLGLAASGVITSGMPSAVQQQMQVAVPGSVPGSATAEAAAADVGGGQGLTGGQEGVVCKQEAVPGGGAMLVRQPSLPPLQQQQQQQAGLAGSMFAGPGTLQLCPGRTDMAAIAAILPAPPGMTNESHMAEVSALLATAFSTATALGSVHLSALVTELVRALDEHITALKGQQEGSAPPPPLLRSEGSFGSGGAGEGSGSFANWAGPAAAAGHGQGGSEGGSAALHVPFSAPLSSSGINGDVIPAHAGATGVLERHLAATAAAQGLRWQGPRATLAAPVGSVPAGPHGRPSPVPVSRAGGPGLAPHGTHMNGGMGGHLPNSSSTMAGPTNSSGSPVWRHSPMLQPQVSSSAAGHPQGPWMMGSGQQQQQQRQPPHPHLQHQQQQMAGYQGQPSAAAGSGMWTGAPHPQGGLSSSGGSGNMAHLVGGHGSAELLMAPPTVPTPPPYSQAGAGGGGPAVHPYSSGMAQAGAPLQRQGSWGAPATSNWQQQQQQQQQLGQSMYEGQLQRLGSQGSGLGIPPAAHAAHQHQQQQHAAAAAGLQGGMSQQHLPPPAAHASMQGGAAAATRDGVGLVSGSVSTAAATCAASYHMLMAGHGMAAAAAEQFGPGPSTSAAMCGVSSSMGYTHNTPSRSYDLGPVELPLPLPPGDAYPCSLPMVPQSVGQPVHSTPSQFDLPIPAPQGHITGSTLASFSPADHSTGYNGFDFDRGYQGASAGAAGGMGPAAHPSNYISSSGAPSAAPHMGSNWSASFMTASERATASGSSTTTSTGVFMSSPVFQEHKAGNLGSGPNILSMGPSGWPGNADAAAAAAAGAHLAPAGMQQQQQQQHHVQGAWPNQYQALQQQQQQQAQVVPTPPNWADMMGPPPYPHELLHTGHNSLLGEATHAVNA